MELWDAYTAKIEKTGETLIRGQQIPNGLFHLVAEAIIQAQDGSVLFMKRDSHKPIYPNYYEASAGGSVLKDETSLTAIKREIHEETGLSPQSITFLSETVVPEEFSIYHNYYAFYDGDKSIVTLQEGETTEWRWIALEELPDFLDIERVIPKQKELLTHYLHTKQWEIKKEK